MKAQKSSSTTKSEKKVTEKKSVTKKSTTKKVDTEIKTSLYSVSNNRSKSTDENIEKTFEKVKGRNFSTPQTREAELKAISKAKIGTEIVYKEGNDYHDIYQTYKKVGKNKWNYQRFDRKGNKYASRDIDNAQTVINVRENYLSID